jgi:hypothetical protein
MSNHLTDFSNHLAPSDSQWISLITQIQNMQEKIR